MNSQFLLKAICNDHVKFHEYLLIRSTSKLSLKIDFFYSVVTFEIHVGAVAENWLILQKFR